MNELLENACTEYSEGLIMPEDALMCKQAFREGAIWQKAQILAEIKKMQDDEKKWFMEACEQGEEQSPSGAVVLMKLELLEHNINKLFNY